jgi:Ca2+-binding EF-hand superfamily protein
MATPTYSYDDYILFLEDNEKEKIREIFELFDKNLDGGIDIKELKFILNCKKTNIT